MNAQQTTDEKVNVAIPRPLWKEVKRVAVDEEATVQDVVARLLTEALKDRRLRQK